MKQTALQQAAGMVDTMIRDLAPDERRQVKECALNVQHVTACLRDATLAFYAMQLAMVRVALIEEKRREREVKKSKATKAKRRAVKR